MKKEFQSVVFDDENKKLSFLSELVEMLLIPILKKLL